MRESLGQVVYLFKDKLVNARSRTNCHTGNMHQRNVKEAAEPPDRSKAGWSAPPPSLFKKAVVTRVKEARESVGLTQDQIAEKLGIKQWKYAKYETRSLMPHIYIARFCELCGVSPKELLRDPR